MPNPYPVKVQAGPTAGPVVIDGELVFTDPANQPGGFTPLVELVNGAASTDVAAGEEGLLQLAHADGATLLSYDNPAFPETVDAGIYQLFLTVVAIDGSAEAGGVALARMTLNSFAGVEVAFAQWSLAVAFSHGFAAVAGFSPAATPLAVAVDNLGLVTHSFLVQSGQLVRLA